MSYIKKLIERAVDNRVNLENNKIGCYRIKPRHSYSIYNYDISHITKDEEKTIITFQIDSLLSTIKIYGFANDKKPLKECFDVLVEIYPDFKIDSFYSKLKNKYEGKK